MLNGQNYQTALKWREVQIVVFLVFFKLIPPYTLQAFKIPCLNGSVALLFIYVLLKQQYLNTATEWMIMIHSSKEMGEEVDKKKKFQIKKWRECFFKILGM